MSIIWKKIFCYLSPTKFLKSKKIAVVSSRTNLTNKITTRNSVAGAKYKIEPFKIFFFVFQITSILLLGQWVSTQIIRFNIDVIYDV